MINDWLSYIQMQLSLDISFQPASHWHFHFTVYKTVWNFLIVHSALHLLLLIISCVVKKIIFTIGRKTDVWYAIDLDTGIKQQTLKLDGTETVCPMMSNKRAPVFLGRTGTLIDLHFISPSYICSIFLQIKKMIYFKMVS